MAENRSALDIVRRRTEIEVSLERCRDAAAENIVEIGRWLNRAKAENVVPHGEWGAWINEHAGMNERTAQRAMQIARELPEGSPLARLGVAKISSLLTLPAAEREEAAARMEADRISSREVESQVKAMRAERDEALRVMAEMRKARLVDSESLAAAQREVRAKETTILTLQHGRKVDEAEISRLRGELQREKQNVKTVPDPEQERRVRLLEAQLKEKTAELGQRDMEIDRLSDQLDQAKTAALRNGMTGGEVISPSTQILGAIGAFMTQAGGAVGRLEQTAYTLDEESKSLLIGQASVIGALAMRVIAACGGDTDGL